jgi:hypothetical protein
VQDNTGGVGNAGGVSNAVGAGNADARYCKLVSIKQEIQDVQEMQDTLAGQSLYRRCNAGDARYEESIIQEMQDMQKMQETVSRAIIIQEMQTCRMCKICRIIII